MDEINPGFFCILSIMLFGLIFLLEIILLYFLSGRITKKVSGLIYKLTKSKKWTIWLTSVFFLPGTFLHEISHFLTALVLFIPLGKINFTPEFENDEVRLGSVEIGKTDFLRRFIVGVAPVVFGVGFIYLVLLYTASNTLLSNLWVLLLVSYFVFEIGNTMFSSRKDMEGAWKLLVLILVLGAAFYFLGSRVYVSEGSFLSTGFIEILKLGNIFLAVPIVIDLLLLLSMSY